MQALIRDQGTPPILSPLLHPMSGALHPNRIAVRRHRTSAAGEPMLAPPRPRGGAGPITISDSDSDEDCCFVALVSTPRRPTRGARRRGNDPAAHIGHPERASSSGATAARPARAEGLPREEGAEIAPALPHTRRPTADPSAVAAYAASSSAKKRPLREDLGMAPANELRGGPPANGPHIAAICAAHAAAGADGSHEPRAAAPAVGGGTTTWAPQPTGSTSAAGPPQGPAYAGADATRAPGMVQRASRGAAGPSAYVLPWMHAHPRALSSAHIRLWGPVYTSVGSSRARSDRTNLDLSI